jgi:hypothetical protein
VDKRAESEYPASAARMGKRIPKRLRRLLDGPSERINGALPLRRGKRRAHASTQAGKFAIEFQDESCHVGPDTAVARWDESHGLRRTTSGDGSAATVLRCHVMADERSSRQCPQSVQVDMIVTIRLAARFHFGRCREPAVGQVVANPVVEPSDPDGLGRGMKPVLEMNCRSGSAWRGKRLVHLSPWAEDAGLAGGAGGFFGGGLLVSRKLRQADGGGLRSSGGSSRETAHRGPIARASENAPAAERKTAGRSGPSVSGKGDEP